MNTSSGVRIFTQSGKQLEQTSCLRTQCREGNTDSNHQLLIRYRACTGSIPGHTQCTCALLAISLRRQCLR
jgi:hypothetical protein